MFVFFIAALSVGRLCSAADDICVDDALGLFSRTRFHDIRHNIRHQRHDPIKQASRSTTETAQHEEEEREADTASAAWEGSSEAAGVLLNRSGSALVSGAFAYTTGGFNQLFAVLEEALLGAAPSQLEEAARLKKLNSSMNVGFKVNHKETADGSGTYFLSEIHPNCKKHSAFGDTDCVFKWGESMTLHGGILVAHLVDEGTTLRIQSKSKLSALPPGVSDIDKHPDIDVTCEACGNPCQIKVGMKTYNLDSSPCPLEPGFYDYWSKDIRLPDNLLVRAIDFSQHISMTMFAKNGTKVFTSATSISTFNEGFGSSWSTETEE